MSSFKTVYFSDYPSGPDAHSGLTVAFSDDDKPLSEAAARLSSFSIRTAIGHDRFADVQRASAEAGLGASAYVRDRLAKVLRPSRDETGLQFDAALQSTFTGGKGSPLHDWFPYLEGYSPEFVRTIIETHAVDAQKVLDPFCGSGTTAITAARMGLMAQYCEVNPVCRSVIAAKALVIGSGEDRRHSLAQALEHVAAMLPKTIRKAKRDGGLATAAKFVFGDRPFFDDDVHQQILSIRTVIDDLEHEDQDLSKLVEVAVMGTLVGCSRLVRRGDLRFKNEKELRQHQPNFIGTVMDRLYGMASDLKDIALATGAIEIAHNDARKLDSAHHGTFDAIVTSPPYLNGTNYFRNTKIELWFSRHLAHKDGLRAYRDAAITSGINDVTNGKTGARALPKSKMLNGVLADLQAKAYDQRIPKMVASYFAEMAEVGGRLADVAGSGGIIAIDLGDSCYGDVFVPTDIILRGIMEDAGCRYRQEVVLRERQSRSGRALRQTLQIFEAR